MDLKTWLRRTDRPESSELDVPVNHYPCSDYRCPEVMRVFLAGFATGFRLTDDLGQPTAALWELVACLQPAVLCTVDGLTEVERRGWVKKTPLESLRGRWYIRGLSSRLRANAPATMSYGWAWQMFPGLSKKGLTVTDEFGQKTRRGIWLVEVKPNWELSDRVYHGLWVWAGRNPTTQWEGGYQFLDRCEAADRCGGPGKVGDGGNKAVDHSGAQLPAAGG